MWPGRARRPGHHGLPDLLPAQRHFKARDADAFTAEIEGMNAFYEPATAATTIDADGRLTRHYDEDGLMGREVPSS